MVHHEDGSVLTPGRWPWQHDTLAFGWLDAGHAFRQGACPPALLGHLEAAARHPVDRTRGFHVCTLCPPPATPDERWGVFGPTHHQTTEGDTLALGSASLEVHAGRRRWVAPNLVLHYIAAHGYLPPDEVVGAVASS
ncbi:hypothetical protein ET989_12090 [Propioniciclava sinopodophylli]|uniref:DUF7919 domain-containing protein n=1 Tax=Propioniciclava sinopodophylli TaxID=1837344 RepID=A0A4Q9KBJ4_9ACTN|nr:hypothetical protein [Propioniciclava sinopodophylli]TBT83210.1 hypothetical protein ET989_12090 [Propioniciclava sinopodophylli]